MIFLQENVTQITLKHLAIKLRFYSKAVKFFIALVIISISYDSWDHLLYMALMNEP